MLDAFPGFALRLVAFQLEFAIPISRVGIPRLVSRIYTRFEPPSCHGGL